MKTMVVSLSNKSENSNDISLAAAEQIKIIIEKLNLNKATGSD